MIKKKEKKVSWEIDRDEIFTADSQALYSYTTN